MPGVETTNDVDHVAMAGAFEQAASDHAAVSTLAMDGEWLAAIHVRQALGEIVEGAILRLRDMTRLPFALATNVEHSDTSFSQFSMQLVR